MAQRIGGTVYERSRRESYYCTVAAYKSKRGAYQREAIILNHRIRFIHTWDFGQIGSVLSGIKPYRHGDELEYLIMAWMESTGIVGTINRGIKEYVNRGNHGKPGTYVWDPQERDYVHVDDMIGYIDIISQEYEMWIEWNWQDMIMWLCDGFPQPTSFGCEVRGYENPYGITTEELRNNGGIIPGTWSARPQRVTKMFKTKPPETRYTSSDCWAGLPNAFGQLKKIGLKEDFLRHYRIHHRLDKSEAVDCFARAIRRERINKYHKRTA